MDRLPFAPLGVATRHGKLGGDEETAAFLMLLREN